MSTCSGQAGYSRITDAEMKAIMRSAVNKVYALLLLKSSDPDKYEFEDAVRRAIHPELG